MGAARPPRPTGFVRSLTWPIFRYGSSLPRMRCHQRLTSWASEPVRSGPRPRRSGASADGPRRFGPPRRSRKRGELGPDRTGCAARYGRLSSYCRAGQWAGRTPVYPPSGSVRCAVPPCFLSRREYGTMTIILSRVRPSRCHRPARSRVGHAAGTWRRSQAEDRAPRTTSRPRSGARACAAGAMRPGLRRSAFRGGPPRSQADP